MGKKKASSASRKASSAKKKARSARKKARSVSKKASSKSKKKPASSGSKIKAASSGKRINWLDDRTQTPLIDERARNLATFLDALADGIVAFTGGDAATWAAIVEHERIPGGKELIAEAVAAAESGRVVQDCSAIRSLCTELGVAEELHIDW